jgi:hypothetical protein
MVPMTNHATPAPATDAPSVPGDVTIVPNVDPRTLWAATGTHVTDDVAATMTTVDTRFGRTAATDITNPDVGIGRGHRRPHVDANTHPAVCTACRTFMSNTPGRAAFPTRSRVPANIDPADPNRGTRVYRCRACRDNDIATHDAYVAAGRPDRSRWAIDPATAVAPFYPVAPIGADGDVIAHPADGRPTRTRRTSGTSGTRRTRAAS